EDLSRDYYESLSFGGPSDGGVTLQPGDSYCGDSSACIIGESCDCPECTPDCGDNLACNDGVCDTHNAQSAVGAAAGTTPAEDDANAGNTVDTSGLIDPDSIIIPEVISDELLLEHFNIDCLDIEDVETEFIAFVEIAEKLYDLDGDTVPNDVECNVGLNPLDINSDNDQLNDACEYKFNGYEGFNLAGEEEPIEFLGLDDDYDGDGDTNEEECGKSDEILDPFEIYQYTNPLEPTFMTFDLETFCVREFEQLGGGDIDTIIGMVSNEEQVKDLDEDEVPNLVECSNGMLVGNSYFSNYQSQRTDESGADRGEIVNYFTTNPFMINTDGDVFNDACEYEFSDEGDFSTKPIEEDGVVTISNPVLGIIDYEMGFPDDYDGDGKSNADECGPSNSLNPPDVSEYTNPVAIELEQFEMEGCNDGEEFKFEDRTILIEPTYEFFSNILGLIEVADATTDGSPELIIEARKDLDLDLVSSKIECSLDVEPYTLNAERLLDELTEIIYPRKTSPLSSDTDGDDLTDTCEYEFYFIDENMYSTDPGIITTANEDEGGVDSDHPENGALLDNFDGDDWTNIEECGPEMDREDYTNPGGSDMEGSNIENLATQDSTIEQLSGSPYGTDIGVDKNFLDATYYCKYDSDNAPLRVYDFTLRRNEELINLNSDDPEQNRENSIRGKGEELRLVKGMYACSADGLRIETCGEVGDVQTKNEITCLSGTRCFGPPSLNYDPDFYDDEKIFGPSCMKVNAENPWCEHTVSDVRSSVDKSIAETVTYFTPPGYFITPTETTYIKCKGSGEWGRETNCHDSTQRASELYQFQGRETPCMDVCDANTPMAGADSVDFNPDTAVFDGTSFNFGETRCGENQRGESVAVVCHQYGNQISVPGGNHEDLKYTDWRYAEAGTCEIFDTQCVYDYNFQLGRYAARCTCPDLPAKVKELVDGVNDIDSEWYENIDVSKSEELKDMDLDALHQVFNYPEKSYYRFAIPGDEKTPESNCPYWCDLSYYNNHEYGDGTLQRIEHMDDGGPKDDALVTRDFVLYGRSICNPGNSQQIVTCRMRDKGQGIGLVGTTTNGLSADKQCTGGLYTGGKVGTDINQPKLECTNIKPDVEPGFPSAKVARVTNDNCKFCAKGSVGYYGAIGDIAVKNYEQYECQDSGTSASWVKTVAWGLSLPEGVKRLIEAEFTTYSEGVGQRLSVAKYHHSNDVWCYSYDARYELLQSGCTTQETCENAISSMANADKYVLLEDLSCGTLDTSISDGAYQLGSASIDDAKDAVFQCYAAKEKGKDRKYGWANLLGIDTDNNICGQQQYCDSTGGTFTCKDY
ncbi:hypothetical protein HN451_01465, partial [archaeon]|nr:hypothetical protein [archaeon]